MSDECEHLCLPVTAINFLLQHWIALLVTVVIVFTSIIHPANAQTAGTLNRHQARDLLELKDNITKGEILTDTSNTQKIPVWTTPADLTVTRCIDDDDEQFPRPDFDDDLGPGGSRPEPGLCGNKPASTDVRVRFHRNDIEHAAVVASGRVRFGPFNLKRAGIGKASSSTDTYSISVFARSPAVYGKNPSGGTEFLGANATMKRVGGVQRTLTGTADETVFVEANLTSVFNAIKIVVSVANKSATYPEDCGDLPQSSEQPLSIDAGCLQATINPLAVLNLNWVPLSIIYEPPGNCSWSNLTESNTAGVSLSAGQQTSTSTQHISDTGFFWDQQHSDYTREQTSGSTRSTSIKLSHSASMGTRLGLPLNNPGNPLCNTPGAEIPLLPTQGPGNGEVFVLLRNASMIYWDTAGLQGSTLSPTRIPGLAEEIHVLSAHAIRTGEGLPPGVEFTTEEQQAILGLSPFSRNESGDLSLNLDPSRFLPIGTPIGLQQGLAREHSESRQITVSGGKTLTEVTKSVSAETDSDIAVDLAMAGLQYALGKAASGAATAALKYIQVSQNETFHAGADKVSLDIPKLFTDKSTTTISTRFSNSRFIERTEDSAVTQQFFLQDTNQGMNVSLFYDRLFGTYAFVPHAQGTGFTITPALQNLPSFVWPLPSGPAETALADMPRELQRELATLKSVLLKPASNRHFTVSDDHRRVSVNADIQQSGDQWQVTASPANVTFTEKDVGLLIAQNAQGEPVAQVWLSGGGQVMKD